MSEQKTNGLQWVKSLPAELWALLQKQRLKGFFRAVWILQSARCLIMSGAYLNITRLIATDSLFITPV